MSYSTDMASLLAKQLSRFVTLNPHQLAGQVANLDFWLAEIRHALTVIDGYGVRFIRMEGGQEQYVATHNTTISELEPAGPRERTPPLPRRISDRELRQARRALTDATRQFLERCRLAGLIPEPQLSAALDELGNE